MTPGTNYHEGLPIYEAGDLFRAEIEEEQQWDDALLQQLEIEYQERYPLERPDTNPAGEPWVDPVGGTHYYEPGEDYDPAKLYE